jgi:hypothetical protein
MVRSRSTVPRVAFRRSRTRLAIASSWRWIERR